jgi:hypothetical protein
MFFVMLKSTCNTRGYNIIVTFSYKLLLVWKKETSLLFRQQIITSILLKIFTCPGEKYFK